MLLHVEPKRRWNMTNLNGTIPKYNYVLHLMKAFIVRWDVIILFFFLYIYIYYYFYVL